MDLTYFEMMKLNLCEHDDTLVLVIDAGNKAHYRCTHCGKTSESFPVPPPGDWLR